MSSDPETSTPRARELEPGDKILHPYNRELGPGRVEAVTAQRLTVHFPRTGDTLQFAVGSHPLVPLALQPGADPDQWLEDYHEDMVERLARLDVDHLAAFRNRVEALRLMRIREARGLGSFLGGRIELFPHQLHVAETAARRQPVRWLLADEVGLGKTVEACLILNHLVRTGEAERVLVVAPRSLVVQWLGELWRKFHQVFVLVDRDRREDVRREKGPGFNPFEVYDRSVVALEDLVEDASLARLAQSAAPDLLVVDEAHRLRRRRGTPGSPEYRAVAPLCERSENVLLLSATPLEADVHGFFRLLKLLRPDELTSVEDFERDLAEGRPLPPCTSSTSRRDVGGLPPRVPHPVDLPPFPERERLELETLSLPADDPVQRAERLQRFARVLAEPVGREDPRLAWLGAAARRWAKRAEKTLVFVSGREALALLKKELEYHTSRRVAVFHEDLSPAQRDLEVARFAEDGGPPLLIATESGGEGRNFQFARRLVLFDLPWDPVLVEQRIGRLDRINRRSPVEIVYFRPAEGFGAEVARLYEALGVFQVPLGGLDRALGHVVEAIHEALDGPGGNLDIPAIVAETREARERVAAAVYHHLHAERYRPGLAGGILARIPEDLERRTAAVILEACRQFGFEMEPKGGRATWYLEFGAEATVEALHGVPAGSRFLGTFDRAEAVGRESLDFFASGHPLVEGILGEYADGTSGQVALLELPGAERERVGVLFGAKEGPETRWTFLDLDGRERPELAETILDAEVLREIPAAAWSVRDWGARVRALAARVDLPGRLVAVAGVRFRA
jgi:ATP-dependent helicase HepA